MVYSKKAAQFSSSSVICMEPGQAVIMTAYSDVRDSRSTRRGIYYGIGLLNFIIFGSFSIFLLANCEKIK